jgi:hypothetical protein
MSAFDLWRRVQLRLKPGGWGSSDFTDPARTSAPARPRPLGLYAGSKPRKQVDPERGRMRWLHAELDMQVSCPICELSDGVPSLHATRECMLSCAEHKSR